MYLVLDSVEKSNISCLSQVTPNTDVIDLNVCGHDAVNCSEVSEIRQEWWTV